MQETASPPFPCTFIPRKDENIEWCSGNRRLRHATNHSPLIVLIVCRPCSDGRHIRWLHRFGGVAALSRSQETCLESCLRKGSQPASSPAMGFSKADKGQDPLEPLSLVPRRPIKIPISWRQRRPGQCRLRHQMQTRVARFLDRAVSPDDPCSSGSPPSTL